MARTLQKKKVKGNKTKAANKGKLDISLIAVIDNIAFSKTDRWAYYRLKNSAYDYLSTGSKERLGVQINNALNAIMGERQKPLECHLIVASMPVDIEAWRAQNEESVKEWSTPASLEKYLSMQEEYLRSEEYMKKAVYLGINLGQRGSLDIDAIGILEGGVKAAMDTAKSFMSTVFQTPNNDISKSEEEYSRNREREFYQILSTGHLEATRCTAEEILLLIKRQMYPAMPVPYLDVDHENRLGPGDLAFEFGHVIRNKFRWMEITQMVGDQEMTGYRACLTFSKFPKAVVYPDTFPFMYFLSRLGLPFTLYSRFTFHNVSSLKKEVEKKEKESRDELDNISSARDGLDQAVSGGLPPAVVESLDDMRSINEIISSDKSPWIEGSYHVVVETPDEATLRKYCALLKQQYSDLDINLSWTAGDQAKLFLEQMPGDKRRIDSFNQITSIGQVAFSGATLSSEIGDSIKPRSATRDRVKDSVGDDA